MAFEIPISTKTRAKPITTITIPINPKSEGESNLANIASVIKWSVVTIPVDSPLHLAPETACAFKDNYFFLAITKYIQVHCSLLSIKFKM